MSGFALGVREDRLEPGVSLTLSPANRILYVVHGAVLVQGSTARTDLTENAAWHGDGACELSARASARLWRWDLTAGDAAGAEAAGALKLARTIDLDPSAGHLMRCDRVDFPLGGVAYTHTHRGPGIRVLLSGSFRVETGGHVLALGPGDPWFESGPEPVYAEASTTEPTSFVRVMVLPVEILGKSSIRYVRPEDQDKPKTQRYTIFVDTPIAL